MFDWRSMGAGAYLPLVVAGFLVLITIANNGEFVYIMTTIEMLFPFFGAWWSVFLLNDTLSESGNEVLFSLPIKRWHLGIVRVLAFFVIYLSLLVLMLLGMGYWIGFDHMLSLGIQLGAQSFFYSGLGFLAMVVTANTGWSLVVVVCYLSLQILTNGQSLSWIDIYLHNSRPIPVQAMSDFLRKTMILGIVLYLNAQYFFSTTTRLK